MGPVSVEKKENRTHFLAYVWVLVGLWTATVAASLAWNLRRQKLETHGMALSAARVAFEKDVVYRRWCAGHGGVYAPITQETPPNPYLSHIPERDITTPSGRKLTLVNPAYMTRQVHELGEKQYGAKGHITSLKPLRPENSPDAWETEALKAFERGATEVSSVEALDGQPYVRLMRPLYTEQGCLKCHAAQGHKLGELRGGVSVSVPMAPLQAIADSHVLAIWFGHGGLWLMALAALVVGARQIRRRIRQRDRAEEAREDALRSQKRLNELQHTLLGPTPLQQKLKDVTEAVVEVFDADFCRIWLTKPGDHCQSGCVHAVAPDEQHVCRYPDRCLHLVASSGRYTHTDGEVHRRVPFGCYKIGRVAADQDRKFLTNNAMADPRVHNHAWTRELGLVSFAGYQLRPPDGETIGVLALFAKHPISLEQDALLEMLGNGVAQAVQTANAEHTVRTAHAENEQLLGSISSILVGVDRDGGVLRWNKAAEQTFGIASADIVGKPFRQCGISWDWGKVEPVISQCRASGQPMRVDDLRFTRADGKDGFLGITLTPVNDDANTDGGFLLVGADITGRKILQGQLTQAQKLESIGQLAAGIAHEINTPTQFVGDNLRFLRDVFADLQTVLDKTNQLCETARAGCVEPELIAELDSASKEADVDYLVEEIPKAIEQSLDGVERVAKIVRSMKDFSHPDGEEMQAIDLNRAIESTITVARNEWKYVAELQMDLAPSLPMVPCLPGDLNQAILNIVINAGHAIADVVGDGGEQKGTITISTRYDGDEVEIRISDTGTGIPEEAQPKVFDPFFTTKQVGKGTGQGLAISHSVIVDKHGGSLSFETEPGKGTTFIIRLPIEAESADLIGSVAS